MTVVFVLRQARSDVDEIAMYIAGDRLEAGMRFVRAFDECCARLRLLPFIGRLVRIPGGSATNLRCYHVAGFENWLVFYRTLEDKVHILRVLHGARDVPAVLRDELRPDRIDGDTQQT
jgi:toxin ParE1/3/4